MKGLLFENWPQKLAAIAIGILIWQVVTRLESPVRSWTFTNVPVNYVGLPEGLVKTQDRSFVAVEATIVADVERLNISQDRMRENITVTVDLSSAEPGTADYPVVVRYTGELSQLIQLTARPETITVTVEPWLERTLPVEHQLTGAWEDYRPGPISINPPRVRISGPASLLDTAVEARAIVNLSRVQPGAASEAIVQILDANGRPLDVTIDPASVIIRVSPIALPPSKTVLIQPVWSGSPEPGYRIERYELNPNQIRVVGSAEQLAQLLSVDTQRIDISGLTESRTITIGLNLPPGVRSEEAQEIRVIVTIRPDGNAEPPPGNG